jgi:hypothetical protein
MVAVYSPMTFTITVAASVSHHYQYSHLVQGSYLTTDTHLYLLSKLLPVIGPEECKSIHLDPRPSKLRGLFEQPSSRSEKS